MNPETKKLIAQFAFYHDITVTQHELFHEFFALLSDAGLSPEVARIEALKFCIFFGIVSCNLAAERYPQCF